MAPLVFNSFYRPSVIKSTGILLRNATRLERFLSSHTADNVIKKTPLYDFHVKAEGRMIPFAGYHMPVQYGSHGIASSHLHTREHVSLFDVSHMLQSHIVGLDAEEFLESLVVADVKGLKENHGTLTVFTNEDGGIIDDLIVSKTSEGFLYVVSNAGCAEKDLSHISKQLLEFKKAGKSVDLEVLTDKALIALQGPGMTKVLAPLVSCDLSKLTFMTTKVVDVCGVPNCRITRCGYTGEDGVEISIPSEAAVFVVESILSSKISDVKLAGLGARDTLRIEAGLCLYGNDINETTTPVEAGLSWTIGQRRKTDGGFPGDNIILTQLKNKPLRRRVGFLSTGPPARSHTPILDIDRNKIGEVTSGCPSPSLKQNVAMGYLEAHSAVAGTPVFFDVRKKIVKAAVVKMPFVPSRYYVRK